MALEQAVDEDRQFVERKHRVSALGQSFEDAVTLVLPVASVHAGSELHAQLRAGEATADLRFLWKDALEQLPNSTPCALCALCSKRDLSDSIRGRVGSL